MKPRSHVAVSGHDDENFEIILDNGKTGKEGQDVKNYTSHDIFFAKLDNLGYSLHFVIFTSSVMILYLAYMFRYDGLQDSIFVYADFFSTFEERIYLPFLIVTFAPFPVSALVIITSLLVLYFLQREGVLRERIQESVTSKHDEAKQQKKLRWNSRFFMSAFVLLLISSTLLLAGFSAFLYFISQTDTYIAEAGADQDSYSELVSKMSDSLGVIFNECCAEQGFTRSGFVLDCPVEPSECEIPAGLRNFDEQLCVCLSQPSRTDLVLKTLRETDLCARLENQELSFSNNQRVPGSSLPVSAIFPVSVVPLVGDHEAEVSGCGTGLARGFQFVVFKFFEQEGRQVAIVCVFLSFVQAVILFFAVFKLVSKPEDEDVYFADYLESKKNSKFGEDESKAPSRLKRNISKFFGTGRGGKQEADLVQRQTPEINGELGAVNPMSTDDEEIPEFPRVSVKEEKRTDVDSNIEV